MQDKKFVKWETSSRWVRGQFNGVYVVDSRRARLVWEHEKYPFYYFPLADVRSEYLIETGRGHNGRQTFHLKVGNRDVSNAVYSFTNLSAADAPLNGFVTFRWDKMDHWFEEAEEVFVHARDPYKRIDTLASSRHVRVVIEGQTIAESKRPYLLFETGLPTRYYIHSEDVNLERLTPTDSHTQCPYKGEASYWTVTVNGRDYKDIVWSYPEPIPEIPKIKNLLCFYNEKVDIYVDGELEEKPQTDWS